MEMQPVDIANVVKKIKKEYPFYVTVKKINGRYYLYKQLGKWDKERKRTTVISEYLGRINDKGEFIRRRLSAKENLKDAESLIKEHGGEIIWRHNREEQETITQRRKRVNIEDIDLDILKLLSMDSRMHISKIAKLVGVGSYAARSKIRRLEKEFGVNYILELDISKLGFSPYITFVKFIDKQPDYKELQVLIKSYPKIQFAAILKGEYDLLLYHIEEDTIRTYDDIHQLRRSNVLRNCDSTWHTTPFSQTYSFVPLRKEFIDYVVKVKEWKRTRKHTSPNIDEFTHREAKVLKELSENCTKDFTEIDKEQGLGIGTARYAYAALTDKGIVVRPTITIAEMEIKYIGGIILDIINVDHTYKTWKNRLLDYMTDGPMANKYSLIGYVGLPDSLLLLLPVIQDGDLDKTAGFLYDTSKKGLNKRTFVITNVIIGSLCYRRFDNQYSRHYEILTELERDNIRNGLNYEEMEKRKYVETI